MNRRAYVTSIDAVRAFKRVLQQFQDQVQDAVTSIDLETRRGIDWVQHNRPQYWKRQSRQADDAVAKARADLMRCKMNKVGDHEPSCYEEREALRKAEQRQVLCRQKLQLARDWKIKLDHEADEFEARMSQMHLCLDVDFPRVIAGLNRMAKALAAYAEGGEDGEPGAPEDTTYRASETESSGAEGGGKSDSADASDSNPSQ